jgi:peptidoglycan/LPS O-acetylase OafA/YrhL
MIYGLDLLRFAAALLVVFYHLGHRAWAPPADRAMIRGLFPTSPAYPEIEPLAWTGWVGVQMFFVLSGFVIAASAEHTSAFRFLQSRIARLMPGIWVCATITFMVLLVVDGASKGLIARWIYTLGLPLFPNNRFWVDSVYWTLSVEFSFYGAIFLLLLADQFKRIEVFAVGLGLLSSGLWFFHLLSPEAAQFVKEWPSQMLLLRHGCFFSAGMITWLIWSRGWAPFRASMLLLCAIAGMLEIYELASAKMVEIGRPLSLVTLYGVFWAGMAALAVSLAFNPHAERRFGRYKDLVRRIGLMTYPLYLVHNITGVALLNLLIDFGLPRYGALVAAALAMVGTSWLITTVAEPRLAGVIRQIFGLIGHQLDSIKFLSALFRPTHPVPR